eukprot:gene11840-24821_t
MRVTIFLVVMIISQCDVKSFVNQCQRSIHSAQKKINDQSTRLWMCMLPTETNSFNSIVANGPVPKDKRIFVINGWRWHTFSVLRDIKRFSNKVREEVKKIPPEINLVSCHQHVCGFNWKALMRVERELFFPWLEELLPISTRDLMSDVRNRHLEAQRLSKDLLLLCERYDQTGVKSHLSSMLTTLDQMYDCALSIQQIQETTFVPYVSAYVSEKDQWKFNRKVIPYLGLLDSQIHLVGMAEAIKGMPEEESRLRTQIPRVAQAMMSIWKKRFYLPRTKCLEPLS